MPRQVRMEYAGARYHVINRGNYRSDIFASEGAKSAFLTTLDEAATKQGWRVHAWALMSNHYHLALETPAPNLVDGMQWLQGTFATRFNRLRRENGHIFQGRYKSLVVEGAGGLGALCHYIHLNPVRAGLCAVEQLDTWLWTSLHWLLAPRLRPSWYVVAEPLQHAGGLKDRPAGHRSYLDYLAWLQADEPMQKKLMFDRMSRGWVVGSREFRKELLAELDERNSKRLGRYAGMEDVAIANWEEVRDRLLKRLRRTVADLTTSGKSEPWKVALAATMKARTTVTNRWLGTELHLGNLYEVSRKVSAWQRAPDEKLKRRLS